MRDSGAATSSAGSKGQYRREARILGIELGLPGFDSGFRDCRAAPACGTRAPTRARSSSVRELVEQRRAAGQKWGSGRLP